VGYERGIVVGANKASEGFSQAVIRAKQDGRSELAGEFIYACQYLDCDENMRNQVVKLMKAIVRETAKSDIGKEIILKDGTRTIVAGGETKKEATKTK
jgi:hypothetical protein